MVNGELRAMAYEHGCVITSTNEHEYDVTDRPVDLRASLNRMTRDSIDATLHRLHFQTKRPKGLRKADMVDGFMNMWPEIRANAQILCYREDAVTTEADSETTETDEETTEAGNETTEAGNETTEAGNETTEADNETADADEEAINEADQTVVFEMRLHNKTCIKEHITKTTVSLAKMIDTFLGEQDVYDKTIKREDIDFTNVRKREVISNFRLRVGTVLKHDDHIICSIRGRGGAKGVMKMTKKDKARNKIANTQQNLVALAGTVSDDVKGLPIVQNVDATVRGFIAETESNGGQVALLKLAQNLYSTNPSDFAEVLDYLKSSNTGSAETKLRSVAVKLMGATGIEKMGEGIDNVIESVKLSLMIGYTHATAGENKFDLSNFVSLLEMVKTTTSASASMG